MTILFDGVCKLCNSAVDFILEKAQGDNFTLITLQSKEGQELLDSYDLPRTLDSVVLIKNHSVFTASDAFLEICKHLKAPWKWLTVFRIIPKTWRNAVYRQIAAKRYKWFGKRTSCRSF
ncbi:DCC1-like thiol-disulfide oxidoreductase family protein [uncultured Draconibacterium sp.]|uniref:thiol-disulfide oxidoreductase DCC family protein n=1 Tax=uncultured Draconibacterium sp. TaxID=1573823 RepID=UPI003260C884